VALAQMATDDDHDPILNAAKKLATILRERRAFTNVATFDLKCEVSRTDGSMSAGVHLYAGLREGLER